MARQRKRPEELRGRRWYGALCPQRITQANEGCDFLRAGVATPDPEIH